MNVVLIPIPETILCMLDALWKHGSKPRYITNDNPEGLYSEHAGALVMQGNTITGIFVSGNTLRVDPSEPNIYMPYNEPFMKTYTFLFHTHPNATYYGSRVKDGILYEFPSVSDIANFMKYHDEGVAQGSIIIVPEGCYVIRQKKITRKSYGLRVRKGLHDALKSRIWEIERLAITNLANRSRLYRPDTFHHNVSTNLHYLGLYNQLLEPYNIVTDYFPRIKQKNRWVLSPVMLLYNMEHNQMLE